MSRVLLVFVGILLIAFAANAQTTNGLSGAEIQGQELAEQLLQENPATNFTQTGTLTVRNKEGEKNYIPIKFITILFPPAWTTFYVATLTNNYHDALFLTVTHHADLTTDYSLSKTDHSLDTSNMIHMGVLPSVPLKETQIMAPFAGSDFWIADLGLEFFHWPEQKILKHETKRTRACTVLESTNPNPVAGGYSRVDCWIDDESLAIVWAQAYDINGKLLKIFNPRKVKKVNGQWELEEMEIQNVQTGSRTWIKFDLK